MLDSIYVGMTGLSGYSQGLRVIANNTANVNTPGFKGSSLQFADMFYSSGGGGGMSLSDAHSEIGYGLNTNGTQLSFSQGELRQTGNGLDMAIDGQGLFVLQDVSGNLTYTRAGQFDFDTELTLISKTNGAKVMGLDATGGLTTLSIAGAASVPGQQTGRIQFGGNLSSAQTTQTVSGLKVHDSAGGEHSLTLRLTNTNATTAGSWTVELLDDTTVVGTGQVIFANGVPTAATAQVNVSFTPAGLTAIPLTLDFGTDVTSFASGNLSTLAVSNQDGRSAGGLTKASFDDTGTLVLQYSNGQTVRGNRLALGRFDSLAAVSSVGDNEFRALDQTAWHIGAAGQGGFGNVRAGMVEISNVDLSREFSDLIVMQRGYQASSQVISTANDMLQELFQMKGR